jgi:hypothetical protein
MKLAGFLMLIAGGMIAMAAIAVLPATGARVAFLLAGIGVELIGLVLAFREHIPPEATKEEHR